MQEQNIPIDIHIGKLLEWLVSRRIISKDWHKQIPNVRNKIGNAMNDMPSHEDLLILLSGARKYFAINIRKSNVQLQVSIFLLQTFIIIIAFKLLTF